MLYYFIGFSLIGISFFHYSAPFFKELHSDMAIQALMARDFDFPNDAYYWGADRFGSLVPYLAHPLVAIGLDALWAISLVQYLLILTGFLLITQLLGRNIFSLILMQFYCLPIYPWHQIVITGHVLLQFTTFSLLFLYLMERILTEGNNRTLLIVYGLTGTMGVWCTEQLAVTWMITWAMMMWTQYHAKKLVDRRIFFVPGILMALGFSVILWIKSKVPLASGGGFHALRVDPEKMGKFVRVSSDTFQTLFQFEDPVFSAYVLLFSILLAISLIGWLPKIIRGRGADRTERILSVTLLSIMALFLLTLLSQWVQDRRYQIRYFLPMIFLSGFFMVYGTSKLRPMIIGLLLGAFSLTGLISLYVDQHVRFKVPHWSYDPADMKTENNIGRSYILGSYWTSYVMAAQSHPESVGTPNDREQVRHEASAVRVMSADSIMVVGNRWLKEGIPDTLIQFGWALERIGPDLHQGRLYYAYFQKSRMQTDYHPLRDCRSPGLSGLSEEGDHVLFHSEMGSRTRIAERGRIYLEPGNYQLTARVQVESDGGTIHLTARRGGPSGIFETGSFSLMQGSESYTISFSIAEPLAFFEFSVALEGVDSARIWPFQLDRISDEGIAPRS